MKINNAMVAVLLSLSALLLILTVKAPLVQSVPDLPGTSATTTPHIVRIGSLPVSQEHVAVQGQFAYVLDWAKRIRVVDISDPISPTIVGVGSYHDDCYVPPHCFPWYPALGRLIVSGTYAYIPLDGLRIVDVSNPTSPTEAISVPLGADAVALQGEYAYVSGRDYLFTIDVSNPLSPTVVLSSSLPSDGYSILVAGNYLYIRRTGSMSVFDISNPISPTQVSSYTFGSEPYAYGGGPLAVSGNYAYASEGASLYVLDVSSLSQITVTSQYTVPDTISSIAVSEPYLYVVARDLHILDVSDPANPVQVDSYTGLLANGLAVADGYIFSASYWNGLTIFRLMTHQIFLPLILK